MQRFICVCALLLVGAEVKAPAAVDAPLEGRWEVVASTTVKGPVLWREDRQEWSFAKDRATFHTTAKVGIPLDGSVFEIQIDASKSPKRFKLSFREGEEIVFAYGIFDRHDDTLIVRMLFPLGLGSSNASEEAIRAFEKSPYPSDFSVQENDATVALILRRVAARSANPKGK